MYKTTFKIIALVFIFSVSVYGANDFSGDSHCKAVWNFESGAVPFLADSKGSNTLANQGADEDTVNYKQGSCSAKFIRANTDRLYILNASLDSGFPLKSGESNKTFSTAFWFKCNGTISNNHSVGGFYSASNYSYLMWLTSSKLTLYLSSNGTTWTDAAQHVTDLVAGRWYHAGVTYNSVDDSVRIRIWDDTAQAIVGTDLTSTEGDINIGTANFYVGSSGASDAPELNIDEKLIFNDVLTVDEIDQIRAGTYGGAPPPSGGQVIMIE